MQFRLITSLLILVLISGTTWAQSTIIERLPDPALIGGGVANGQFTDRPGEDVIALTLISLSEETELNTVTVFMTNLFEDYPVGGSGTAIMNIWPEVSGGIPLGVNTLTGGGLGPASASVDYVATANGLEVVASGLSVTLPAGDYFIGLSPVLDFGANGQEFLQDAGSNGQATLLDNSASFIQFIDPDGPTGIPINADLVDLPTAFTGMAIKLESDSAVLKGDVNLDGVVNLLDVGPFIDVLSSGDFQAEADTNCDGSVDLLDVGPFVDILSG